MERERTCFKPVIEELDKLNSSRNGTEDQNRSLSGQGKRYMNRYIFYSLTWLYLFLGILSSSARSMTINHNSDQYDNNVPCTTEVFNPAGSIDIWPCLHTSRVHLREWIIRVPGASSYTIYIERTLPSSNTALGESQRGDSKSEEIQIETQDGLNTIPLNKRTMHTVVEVKSNYVTFLYRGSVINSDEKLPPPKFASLSYVATVSGSSKQVCSDDFNQTIPNAYVTVTNRTLGSMAWVHCNAGYRLGPGIGHQVNKGPVCVVKNGILAWEYWPGRCAQFCPNPKPIEHGSVLVRNFDAKENDKLYTKFNLSKRMTAKMGYISVAKYFCHSPYVLGGDKLSICKLNSQNQPAWVDTPRKCVIPSCNKTIKLNEHTGSIVHPNYPRHLTEARPIDCQWRILLKKPSIIHFKFLFLDIPECVQSLITFISATTTPATEHVARTTIATFTNTSTSREWSFSPRVPGELLVTYQQSPSCHVTKHRGFYIQYAIHPHQRVRREVSTPHGATNSSGSVDKPLSVLAPSEASPTDATTNEKDSGSSNGWKIAVGVIIPLILIGVVLFIAYRLYRKKFPVRMILGREFGKFRNPDYDRPRSGISLVRDDADDVFSRSIGSSEHNPEFQTSQFKISYDNRGFDGDDEIDCENEEDKADREFRLRKSWLFKSKESQDGGESRPESTDGADEDNNETGNDKTKIDGNKKDDNEFSDDSDIEAMLQEQQVTPRIKRKGKSGSESSSSSSEDQPPGDKLDENSGPSISHSISNSHEEETKSQDTENADKRPSFIEKVEPLFQQPTFEEVRAQMKARARSMSVDKGPSSPRPRSSSVQVDPSKSARRMSYNDSLDSTTKTDLLKFVHMQNITASVVGVAYLDTEDGVASSMSSVNSNPHLVTDLDDETSGEEGVQQCDVKIVITTDELDANDVLETNSSTGFDESNKPNEVEKERIELETNQESTTDLSDDRKISVNASYNNGTNQANNNDVSESELGNDDEDVASRTSTSGSSSSSDTHFEEHHVALSKPVFSPQVSSVSASSDPAVVITQEEMKDGLDNEFETSESVTQEQHTEAIQELTERIDEGTEIGAALNVIEREDRQFVRADSCESGDYGDEVDINNFQEDLNIEKAQISDCSRESSPLKLSGDDSEPTFSKDGSTIMQSIDDAKVDIEPSIDDAGKSHKALRKSLNVNELATKQDVEYHEVEKDNDVQEQSNLSSQHIEAVSEKAQETNYVEDKRDSGNCENETNDADSCKAIHVIPGPSTTRPENIGNDTKKTIGFTPSPEDIDSNSCSSSDNESISDISDHSTDDNEKMEPSNLESRRRLSPLSLSEDSDVETVALSEKEKNKHSSIDFTLNSLPSSSDLSSTRQSENATVPERQLRVISGIEFSDASSDSSDVYQENPPNIPDEKDMEIKQKDHPALKRISFDVNKYVESFDNDDDDTSYDDVGGGDDEEDLNAMANKENAGTDTLTQAKTKNTTKQIADEILQIGVPGSLLHRDRSSTGGSDDIDAYKEFTDDNIDDILLQAGDNAGNTGVEDSNSHATTQRTIGIDPDVKFSFQNESNKTKITFREEESDDELDV